MGRRRDNRKNQTEIQIAAAAASPSAPPPPPWIELPVEVTANILQRLGAEEILESAEKVCTTWNNVCRRDHLSSNRRDDGRKLGLMCRCAVDRSQGQLADLSIAHFGDDELLNYVALRCGDLRRLVLEDPGDISPSGLTDAVKKLPQLEELHLFKTWQLGVKLVETMTWLLSIECVETIGISCPLSRSFTHNEESETRRYTVSFNKVALAIAKSMSNLHHLQLKGNMMDNEGLKAILDGSPALSR